MWGPYHRTRTLSLHPSGASTVRQRCQLVLNQSPACCFPHPPTGLIVPQLRNRHWSIEGEQSQTGVYIVCSHNRHTRMSNSPENSVSVCLSVGVSVVTVCLYVTDLLKGGILGSRIPVIYSKKSGHFCWKQINGLISSPFKKIIVTNLSILKGVSPIRA